MGAQTEDAAVFALKAVTYRLLHTPASQLPRITPFLSNSLASCQPVLSAPQNGSNSPQVHKLKTQLSTLIQHRTIEGRWTAIVLIKTAIEYGGAETLQTCTPWVRGLLNILSKPDPSTTKRLCLITLTRIFTLTKEQPGLVREITTPSLPTYIDKCLQLALKSQGSLLEAILESFNELLPRHPTIFRSYVKQIQNLLRQTIASADNQETCNVTEKAARAGRRLYVHLAFTAPKGEGTELWHSEFLEALTECHHTANRVFRSLIEDSENGNYPGSGDVEIFKEHEVQHSSSKLGLPPWTGIFAGSERLIDIIGLVEQYLRTPTLVQVKVPLGAVVLLLNRLFCIRIPKAGLDNALQANNQVSKQERENLLGALPNIHIASLQLTSAVCQRLQAHVIPISLSVFSNMLWTFRTEQSNPALRCEYYVTIKQLLHFCGASLDKEIITGTDFISTVQSVCNDLFQPPSSKITSASLQITVNGSKSSHGLSASESAASGLQAPPTFCSAVHSAAHDLLPILLTHVPLQHLPSPSRALLDKTAILCGHKAALLASTINPDVVGGKASVLPLLARLHPHALEVEGLVRPRLPVIKTIIDKDNAVNEEQYEDEMEDQQAEDQIHAEEEQAIAESLEEPQDIAELEEIHKTVTLQSENGIHNVDIDSGHQETGAAPELLMTTGNSDSTAANKRSTTPALSPLPKKLRTEGSDQDYVITSVVSKLHGDGIEKTKVQDGVVSVQKAVVVSSRLFEPPMKSNHDDEDSGSDVEVPMISLADSDEE